MIEITGESNGEKILILGFCRTDIDELLSGRIMKLDLQEIQDLHGECTVVIVARETEEDIQDMFKLSDSMQKVLH